MREITIHRLPGVNDLNSLIRLEPADDPNPVSKGHDAYQAYFKGQDGQWGKGKRIEFQRGPVKRYDQNSGNLIGLDANGLSIEAVLACCIDRLALFQTGKFKCAEDAAALECLKEALLHLHHRRLDRVTRGVDGKLEA